MSSFFLELKEQLETIPDTRRKKGTRYKLVPLLLLLVLGFLRGGKDVKAILQTYAEDREMLDFLGFKRVPAQGTYTNLWKHLELETVNRALENTGYSLRRHARHVALDGWPRATANLGRVVSLPRTFPCKLLDVGFSMESYEC